MKQALITVITFLALGFCHGTQSEAQIQRFRREIPPQPHLSIKSTYGMNPREYNTGNPGGGWESAEFSNNDNHDVQQKKSGGLMHALTLLLPVLFLPALLIALLYLVWAGSYSSYNYHNNYPNSWGVMGGSSVGFGHYGNGLSGETSGGHGKWGKSDRMGDFTRTSQAYVADKVERITPNILDSIGRMSS